MNKLSPAEIDKLVPAESSMFASPIPTQAVSSDEFIPGPQSAKQREFETRVKQIGSELAKKQGVSRRVFFQGAAGMAAAFVAMNETFGDACRREQKGRRQAHVLARHFHARHAGLDGKSR